MHLWALVGNFRRLCASPESAPKPTQGPSTMCLNVPTSVENWSHRGGWATRQPGRAPAHPGRHKLQ
eukprot:396473-Alexandrium_andersonii.AAC.1